MSIIAFCGLISAGKDTACDELVEHLGYKKLAFAKPMKDMCARLFNLTEAQMYTEAGKAEVYTWTIYSRKDLRQMTKIAVNYLFDLEHDIPDVKLARWPHMTPLDLQQRWINKVEDVFGPHLGTRITVRQVLQWMGTEVGRSLWDDVWIRMFERKARMYSNVVVCDARFPNEINCIRRMGGKIVCIERPSTAKEESVLHSSETSLGDTQFDLILLNNGSLEDFKRHIQQKAEGILA